MGNPKIRCRSTKRIMFSITDTTNNALNKSLYQAYEEAANSSMQQAVSEIKAATNDKRQPTNCRVSIDST